MIFIISGPSGSGKTTLVNRVLKARLKKKLVKPVSLTSRQPRDNEKEGVDYFFISEADFRKKIKRGELLEWTKFLGSFYGTSKYQIDRIISEGKDAILCRDIKGAFYFKRMYPRETVTIFILPPSLEELKRRIARRSGKISRSELLKRLTEAKRELKFSDQYDYRIENTNIDLATQQLLDIIKAYQSGRKIKRIT